MATAPPSLAWRPSPLADPPGRASPTPRRRWRRAPTSNRVARTAAAASVALAAALVGVAVVVVVFRGLAGAAAAHGGGDGGRGSWARWGGRAAASAGASRLGPPPAAHGVTARLAERSALLATYALPSPYLLAACAVARDADDVLREWVLRNFLSGVDHVFLYDDTPRDGNDAPPNDGGDGGSGVAALLGPLAPLVTVLPTPPRQPSASAAVTAHPDLQRRAYWDCATRHGASAAYLTHLDADEFFEPRSAAAAAATTGAATPGEYAAAPPGQVPFLHASLWALARRAAAARRPPPPALWGRWVTVLSNGRTVPPPAGMPLSAAYPAACTAAAADRRVRLARLVDWKPVYAPATLNYTAMSAAFFVHGTDSAGGEYQLVHIPPWGAPPRPPPPPSPPPPPRPRPPAHGLPPSPDAAAAATAAAERDAAAYAAAAAAAWRDHGGVAGTPATDWEVRHYWSRSLVEYALKAARGRPNGHPRRSLADLYAREAACAPARTGSATSPPALRAPLVRALLDSLPPPPPPRRATAAAVAAAAAAAAAAPVDAGPTAAAAAAAGAGGGVDGTAATPLRHRAAIAAAAAAARSVVYGTRWCGGATRCAVVPSRGDPGGGRGSSRLHDGGADGGAGGGAAWKMAHLLGEAAAGVALNAPALCSTWGLCDGRDDNVKATGSGGGGAIFPYAWMRYVDDPRLGPEDVEWLPPGAGGGVGA